MSAIIVALWLHNSLCQEAKREKRFGMCRCWGSLSCTVIAPPETDAAALDTAVADLRYGAVCVNLPSFAAFTFPKLSWGAYPGNTPQVSRLSAKAVRIAAQPHSISNKSPASCCNTVCVLLTTH